MSAFLSAQEGHEAVLLTDGAGYDTDGIVRTLGSKVTVGRLASIAIATRGNHVAGRKLRERLALGADRIGVDAALAAFGEIFSQIPMARPDQAAGQLHVHIVAYSETRGLIRLSGHNIAQAFADGENGGVLREVTGVYNATTAVSAEMLAACGARMRQPGESLVGFMFRVGDAMMEGWRRTPATLLADDKSEAKFLIGGQCDLTVVTPDGAATATLRTWPDIVGEKIDPFTADVMEAAA